MPFLYSLLILIRIHIPEEESSGTSIVPDPTNEANTEETMEEDNSNYKSLKRAAQRAKQFEVKGVDEVNEALATLGLPSLCDLYCRGGDRVYRLGIC